MKKDDQEFKVVVTGDFCPNHDVQDRMLGGDPVDFIRPVEKLFSQADVVVGNLETPLCERETPIPKCGPNHIVRPEIAPVFKQLGFDVFCLSNNHIMDQGVEGLESTLKALEAQNIPYCGADMTHEKAARPAVLEIKGKTLAILNFGEGEYSQAQEDGPGAARIEPGLSEDRVRSAAGEYDYVLAVLHLGNEYQPIPSTVTTSLCRRMADAGASAVIAHHSHIPQAQEIRHGVPICFSLGNFLFGTPFSEETLQHHPCWYMGAVAELDFKPDGVALQLHPFRQKSDLTLEELSVAGRKAFAEYLERCRRILADPEQHQRFWEQEARELFRALQPRLAEWAADLTGGDPDKAYEGATILYNIVRCDAHRETMQRGLRLLYEGRFEDDSETARGLSDLNGLIRKCVLSD